MLDIIRLIKKNRENSSNVLFDYGTIKVILAGCLTIAVSLIVMSIISIFIIKTAVLNKLKNVDLQYMARSISATVDSRIEKAVDASMILSDDPTVNEWIKSRDTDEKAGAIAKEKMLKLVRDSGYDTSFLASSQSKNYWSANGQGIKLLYQVSEDDLADSWFFNTLKMKKRYEINIDYDKELKDTFVWINTLVGDVNRPIAVTGVGMNLGRTIKDLIASDSKFSLNNDIWLVDDQGYIYLSKVHKYMNKNISSYLPYSLKNNILNSDASSDTFVTTEYKDQKGEVYDVAYKKIKDTKWNLLIQIPRAESLGFLNKVIFNTLIACFLVIVIIVIMFNILSKRIADPYKRALLINQELENKISERTKELNEKNVKIQDSIDYAKIIQESIIPSTEEINKVFDQCFVIWEPRDTVGGDFYWVRKFNDGTLAVLGDCTGHGVPGSMMTMAVNAVLNQVVDEICHDNPALILSEMDRLLKQNLRRGQNNEIIQDGLDAGILFISRDYKILFSGAHLPIWVGYEEGIKEIRGSRGNVGTDRADKENGFTNIEIEYAPGMTLYMATDGLKDQPGGINKFSFGRTRVKSLLTSIRKMTMSEQRKAIISEYKQYIENEQQRDDIAVIGIRI